MYTGKNPSALHSQEAIANSLLLLMQTFPFEKISIKQIMLESDLSRQTFYQIFHSKEEILDHMLNRCFSEFAQKIPAHTVVSLCEVAKLFFSFYTDNQEFICLLIRNGKSFILQRKFGEFLHSGQYVKYEQACLKNETENTYAISFVVHGLVGMLEQWVQEDRIRRPDAREMASLVCRITNSDG